MDGPGIVQTLDELMTASSFDLMTFPASPATISDPRHRPSHPSPSSCWSESQLMICTVRCGQTAKHLSCLGALFGSLPASTPPTPFTGQASTKGPRGATRGGWAHNARRNCNSHRRCTSDHSRHALRRLNEGRQGLALFLQNISPSA